MLHTIKYQNSFSQALKTARRARGLSQEAFSQVSSRTYVSTLERGLKTPTISKVDELAEVLDMHPLTLLTLSYMMGIPRPRDQPFRTTVTADSVVS